jgi:hypothetical protein
MERVIRTWTASGIIIKDKDSKVIYSNQTGGHCCDHPEERGYFVPMLNPSRWSTDRRIKELKPLEHKLALSENDADFLDGFFKKNRLPLQVDRTRLEESAEAWVHVIISGEDHFYGNAFCAGEKAIFVWENCD